MVLLLHNKTNRNKMIRKKIDESVASLNWQWPYYKRTAVSISENAVGKPGFTLIELLVVIAIIGLLASIVLLALNSARSKSRDAKRIADMNQISQALELYYNDNYTYPTLTSGTNFSALANNLGSPAMVPKYMNKLPLAPTPADGSCGTGTGNAVNDYFYTANSTGPSQSQTGSYAITFCLGGATGALSAGPHTMTTGGLQ